VLRTGRHGPACLAYRRCVRFRRIAAIAALLALAGALAWWRLRPAPAAAPATHVPPLRGLAVRFTGGAFAAHRPLVAGREAIALAGVIDPHERVAALAATGDLAGARAEAANLAADLGGTLLSGPQASGASVRSALPAHALFHFAGHAVFAGSAGWESALLLAGGDRLLIPDILALPQAPRWVVLLACQSGQVIDRSGVASIGLAQAFIAAGSEEVIAASRALDDRRAAELSRVIYRHFRAGDGAEKKWPLAEALRRAQEEAPGSDAAALRAFVP